MCIGIPMRVIESDGFTALCEGRGEQRRVNLMLLDEAPPGGWVLIHLGNAVRVLEEEEASQINEALDALTAALNGERVDLYFADLKRH
ncbi:MAG: HypC/HybG/HupF family hydrogenase formation chaperone [Rhodomicrobium sp.]